MARKLSEKRKYKETEQEMHCLIPIMNLIVILIPMLLISTAFVTISVINVSQPRIGGGLVKKETKKKKKEKKLNLTITITDKGFFIAGAAGVLPGSYDPSKGGKMGGPTIPRKGDEYDYEALTKKISEVKDAFPDETKIIITAEQHIKYEVLIKTMDATREANGRMLFPDVVLSAGVT